MSKGRQKWLGGYVRPGKRGAVYVIERWLSAVKFHISTKCRTERAALKELERFEANPHVYRARGGAEAAAVELTAKNVLRYRAWMLEVKKTSHEWAREVARFLADWIDDLGGADLRSVTSHDLEAALDDRKTSRRHRVESIKGYCTWLRKREKLLTRANDPTLELELPPIVPAMQRRNRVVELERLVAVMPRLTEEIRDVLILKLTTGWHNSEVRRFAQGGTIGPPFRPGEVAVVTTFHKKREPHTVPISHAEQLEAAERVRARGNIPGKEALAIALRDACAAADVEKFVWGDIRPTVLTNAVRAGALVKTASEFAGHKSEATTRNFYLQSGIPTQGVPTLRVLEGGAKKSG